MLWVSKKTVSLNDVQFFEMNSPEIKKFINEQQKLFWYTPAKKKQDISQEFLVETILNYGSWHSVKELIRILGMKQVSDIFFKSIHSSDRTKGNYSEIAIHFYTLFFSEHAG